LVMGYAKGIIVIKAVLRCLTGSDQTKKCLQYAFNEIVSVTDKDLSVMHHNEMHMLIKAYFVLPAFAINNEGMLTTSEAFYEGMLNRLIELAERIIVFNELQQTAIG